MEKDTQTSEQPREACTANILFVLHEQGEKYVRLSCLNEAFTDFLHGVESKLGVNFGFSSGNVALHIQLLTALESGCEEGALLVRSNADRYYFTEEFQAWVDKTSSGITKEEVDVIRACAMEIRRRYTISEPRPAPKPISAFV
jgi:hypothetical protein